MNRYLTVWCGVNDSVEVLVTDCHQKDLHKKLQELVDGYIEVVHPVNLPKPYCMIVNEEGALRKTRQPNLIGTLFYSSNIQIIESAGQPTIVVMEDPIFGDIAIMKEMMIGGEKDLVSLSGDDIVALIKIITDLLPRGGEIIKC